MEIISKQKFVVDVYGSAPASGYVNVLKTYIEDKIDKNLLSFAEYNKKKEEKVEDKVSEILSVFHRDENGYPIIGDWMVRKCILNTGADIFNAMKDKTHPKKGAIKLAIRSVTPHFMPMHNGKLITKPDGVQTYAVTIPAAGGQKGRSFFKAYEFIRAGATLDMTLDFDKDFVSKKLIDFWIEKAAQEGYGAFRERFGTAKVVK